MTFEPTLEIVVDPVHARFSSWYELFPRSTSPKAGRHGTLRDVIDRLAYVHGLGFDVLYLPPIHPIGTTFRKGPNNVTSSGPDDPGVPWAIGGPDGGHTAIHPDLGTIDDFDALVEAAGARGIRIALDIAFQVSPDHPFVREHPTWFRQRPDGTVQYAENPPKKYQDIYPFDFESEDWQSLWHELCSIFEFWIGHGVEIFRVDNPHTKAFPFWEWALGELKRAHPEALFLAEAFTRPKVMYRLAKVGFSQSYTYFTWRTHKQELTEYFQELTHPPVSEFFRPNVWPNTPDILHETLQTGGRPMFEARFVMAATLAATYGIYGPAFELLEHVPREPGSEEYLNSEKYEIRTWDLEQPDSLAPLIREVNRIRREHPALQSNERLVFHDIDDDALLAYTKQSADGRDTVLTVVSLDPHARRAGTLRLHHGALDLDPGRGVVATDLLEGGRETLGTRRSAHRARAGQTPGAHPPAGTRPMTTIEQEDLADSFFAAPTLADDPLWYKDAVIYEVHVRAFRDSNGDGVGDFKGLTEKLDYLRDLGVTTIWVLPFYPSPLKDDGYDIADYLGVHPDYGTMRDVRQFIREAHRRGLRVITELVCNHTSDQHPWFQRARHSPRGSPWRDFYVWTDDPDKYREARIIFKDFETSNWTWDPVAEQYYWHRFYSHQPDLNFENPKVRDAIMRTMDAWLEMGVDGLRLDAIPYLYEREGTNCENLPETHAFLKQLRAHIDKRFAGRMLLAEANQWPEDSVEYFGDGDECHMAFHFPVMPRLFMSVRMEDRFPIIDILEQTPPIPENAQWALFLRNHDELTLEMVTDEERDYMYRVYARDPQMRINLGIRRRLAPLLGNNRRRIELMNGLLMSLPGHAGHLLRRRDRDGRQRLRRRPQRRAHPDAVERRPERGLLVGEPPAAVPAGDHRPRVPLRGGQRRGPAGQPAFAAVVDEAAARPAPAAPRVLARLAPVPPPREPEGPGVPAPARGRDDPRRGEPVALRAAHRARPVRARGPGADRDVRAGRVPGDQRGAVLPHARAPLLPVVLARGAGRRPRRRTRRHPDPRPRSTARGARRR